MKTSAYIAYLVVIVALVLGATEFVSYKINESTGDAVPVFGGRQSNEPKSDRFALIDPLLGYARGPDYREVTNLEARGHTWLDGFAIYGKQDPDGGLQRPVILALGGSTTDPVRVDHSWPEELFKLITATGLQATIINGGTGGYSSNQQLLKLVRDGLEFYPDIVISYGGLLDTNSSNPLPYPMVSSAQREQLEQLTRVRSFLLPNSVFLLQRMLGGAERPRITLGVATKRSSVEWWKRNIELMHAISNQSGAAFCAIVQPANFENLNPEAKAAAKRREQKDLFLAQSLIARQLDYVQDLSGLFAGETDVYDDGRLHATAKGDAIIARRIYELIFEETKCPRPPASAR